jgi:hypothetical protein
VVHVAGAKIAGINPFGYDVLEIGAETRARQGATNRSGPSSPTETISLSPAEPLPVVLGRMLTLGATAILVLQFVALARRRGARVRRPG